MFFFLAFLLGATEASAASINVGIISEETRSSVLELGNQLEDSEVYDIETTSIDPLSVTAVEDLAAYDVLILGDSGHTNAGLYTGDFISIIEEYQANGAGVILSSWMSFVGDGAHDTVSPINESSSDNGYCAGPTSVSITGEHPITDGVSNFTDTSNYAETPGPLDSDATSLATAGCNGSSVLTIAERSTGGRVVYIGLLILGNSSAYNNGGLRSGDADQLIEQAVAWASAKCADEDKDGVSTCASDCDDSNPNVFPGNEESCDGIDNDCDGFIPEEELDNDMDGYATCAADCDDNDDSRFPGNEEICDGIDNDCDESVPDNEVDGDGDGFFECEGDCDDSTAQRSPELAESCDGIDNNCDDQVDEGLEFIDVFTDADNDGYGDVDTLASVCEQPEGTVLLAGDCNDSDAMIFPGGLEIINNDIDEDCDGADLTGCGCSAAPLGATSTLVGFLSLVTLFRRRR